MPFTLIKGRFHVRGYSPDGDSIRFEPENADLLRGLDGFPPKLNARGHAQLRIEAIDGLETHYTPTGGGVYHQPKRWADAAADRLIDFVGIADVQWDDARKTVLAADDGKPGFILARSVEKNGRPVAFVFAGRFRKRDGSSIHLTSAQLTDSFNRAALKEGLAYPTYYKGLFGELRESLTGATVEAREAGRGLWPDDRTFDGFNATGLEVLTTGVHVLPKLFRRLCDYMVGTGAAIGFKKKLSQSREPVLDLQTRNFTHFDTFVEQEEDGVRIRLTRRPEELVFDEMPQRPSDAFARLLNGEGPPPRFVGRLTLPAGTVFDVTSL